METKDLTKLTEVVKELVDSDESVRKLFLNAVSGQVMEFAELWAKAYSMFENFSNDCAGSVQAGLVGGFMHGVLDDSLTAVKVLLTGKMGPCGNLVRQASEGICMAILCAEQGTLDFKGQELVYWKLVRDENPIAEGNRAPHQLLGNLVRLGLNAVGAAQLKKAIENHHAHSHAGRLAMALRMDLGKPGLIYFGGHFDEEKIEGYRAELSQLIFVTKWAAEAINNLWSTVKAIPKDFAPSI